MAEKEQWVEGEKKTSKKLLIIIIVIVVLILGSGAAVYFFMRGQPDGGENTELDRERAEATSQPAEVLYYDISKPLIVDFPKGSWARLIQVSLSFQVNGQETVELMKKHDPMIRNNLLMLISTMGADRLNSREGKDKLRADILTEVGSILEKMGGKNHVQQVFFTAFVMQ